MIEFRTQEDLGITWISLCGRIDTFSSPEIQKLLAGLIDKGERTIVADLQGVNFVSSAGIRIFLIAQKQLNKAGGEIILYRAPPAVGSVFEMGGLLRFFFLAENRQEVESRVGGANAGRKAAVKEINGITLHYITEAVPEKGPVRVIGSLDGLESATYSENDVISIDPGAIRFGLGLAALGDSYREYKTLFGESVIIYHSLFSFPARKHPSVDFMLHSGEESSIQYRFLNGIGFSGSPALTCSFERPGGTVELSELTEAVFHLTDSDLVGLVLLGESRGMYGMHLKKVPISENRPANEKEIFDSVNFPEWMNFPIEPGDHGSIVLGVGVACRERTAKKEKRRDLFPKGSNLHLHAALFANEPLLREIESLEQEIRRVTSGLEVSKVQHLLPTSRFGWGMAGIIELED